MRKYPKDMSKELIKQLEMDLITNGNSVYTKREGRYVRIDPKEITIIEQIEEEKKQKKKQLKG